MHFKWNYEPPTSEQQTAAKELGEKIELIDPFLMNDMDMAVDRLNDAMGRKERIMVYGD